MKTRLLILGAFLMVAFESSAQNSSVEEKLSRNTPDSTQMEKFINKCQFYSYECFFKTDRKKQTCGGLHVEGVVYKDLVTNQKIGGLEVWENEKKEIYYGTLDFDEIDDLIRALRMIINNASEKHYGVPNSYTIYYRTRGGIDVTAIDDFGFGVRLSKKWYYPNNYGIWYYVEYVSLKDRSLKQVADIISGLEKAKEVISKELENPD